MGCILYRKSLRRWHSRVAQKEQRSSGWVGRRLRPLAAASLALLFYASSGLAGPADVVAATARCSVDSCSFVVTVRHDDVGWKHYANAWQVLAPDGSLLATRVLAHPHVNEQPFTRELRGVEIPPSITEVRIRARDLVHGLGGKETVVSIQRPKE